LLPHIDSRLLRSRRQRFSAIVENCPIFVAFGGGSSGPAPRPGSTPIHCTSRRLPAHARRRRRQISQPAPRPGSARDRRSSRGLPARNLVRGAVWSASAPCADELTKFGSGGDPDDCFSRRRLPERAAGGATSAQPAALPGSARDPGSLRQGAPLSSGRVRMLIVAPRSSNPGPPPGVAGPRFPLRVDPCSWGTYLRC
jgi:hypothetical protein